MASRAGVGHRGPWPGRQSCWQPCRAVWTGTRKDFLLCGVSVGRVKLGFGGKPLLNHIQKSVTKGAGGDMQDGRTIRRAGEGELRAEWPVRFCTGYKLTRIISLGSKQRAQWKMKLDSPPL